MMSKIKLLHCPALILLLVLCSCSTSLKVRESGLIQRLNNRGPVGLSTSNPYLAANLLLAKEMESSPELSGFIQHRGAPAALELEKPFFSALHLKLYYPENREYYDLEDIESEWVIRGPFVIDSEVFPQVALIARKMQGKPVLKGRGVITPPTQQLQEQTQIFPNEDEESANGEDPVVARLRQYNQTEQAKHFEGTFRSPQSPNSSVPSTSSSTTPTSTLEAFIEKAPDLQAELTPKGDLVHYITFSGETLTMIARWYTLDASSTARIARMNRLRDPNTLNVGDVVVIPSYLVRNRKRLPEDAVEKLQMWAEREKQMNNYSE